MTTLVKKRVQYTVDQAIMESAEYIMTKVGLTPATVMSMVYAEIARTGKIFLGKHYNHINQMIKNGGKITYVTSEDFNTVRDTTEYKDNQDTALTILKRLKDIYPDRVNIGFLPTPVNISMYYLKLHDGTEYINVKFNFQTYHGNDKHPMFDLFPNNPMFPIFQHEIVGLQKLIIPIE